MIPAGPDQWSRHYNLFTIYENGKTCASKSKGSPTTGPSRRVMATSSRTVGRRCRTPARRRSFARFCCSRLLWSSARRFGTRLSTTTTPPTSMKTPRSRTVSAAKGSSGPSQRVVAACRGPLTWLSYLFDFQVCGVKPWGYHLTNVLLHAATTLVLFLVLRRMTGDFWPSVFVAAVFAIHPLRAEAVAWVAERKGSAQRLVLRVDHRCVSPLCPLSHVSHPVFRGGGAVCPGADGQADAGDAAAGALAVGLLAAGANGWLGRKRSGLPWRLVVEKIPLLALAAASCVVTRWPSGRPLFPPISCRSLSVIANALVSYVSYLDQLFRPVGLSLFYPHPEGTLPAWKAVVAAVFLLGISAGALTCWRRFPYLLVGWFWYLGMLVPAIGLAQVGEHAMADRYTYLPQIGLCLALTWGVTRAVASWPLRRWACGVAAAMAVAALMACAWRQTTFWQDSDTLWNHALECNPRNSRAHANLGHLAFERKQFEEAAAHYRKSLEIKPGWGEIDNNLGNALLKLGRVNEAIACYRRAIDLKALAPGRLLQPCTCSGQAAGRATQSDRPVSQKH